MALLPNGGNAGPSKGPGPFRGLGWLAAAVWWSVKSPASFRGLAAAALPWCVCSVLALPTALLSIIIALGLYAQLALWSALCAKDHFMGAPWTWPTAIAQWKVAFKASRPLALAFAAVAVGCMVWMQACVSLTGIGSFLSELRELGVGATPEAATRLLDVAMAKEGMDGLRMPFFMMQLGLGVANGIWCLLPWRHLSHPSEGPRALLAFGCKALLRAPLPMCLLGWVGVGLAEASVIFPPASLLVGVWFCACAFAARDIDKAVS